MSREYELFPGMNQLSKPAFKSQEEYERFRLRFQKDIEPQLIKYRQARARSEEAARTHWVD